MIAALLLLTPVVWLWPNIQFSLLSPQEKLAFLIKQDFDSLRSTGYLPKNWNEIGSIEVHGDKYPERPWLHTVSLPLFLKPNGERHLEVQVLPWESEGRFGAVVNYELLDRKTKNTLWEFGRTFEIGVIPALAVADSNRKAN